MATSVSVTLIICITIIIVTAIIAFSSTDKEAKQKVRDIDRMVSEWDDLYLSYDNEKEKYTCSASDDDIKYLCRAIRRIC